MKHGGDFTVYLPFLTGSVVAVLGMARMFPSDRKLDQLYVQVSSAHKTTPRDMTCTVLKAT